MSGRDAITKRILAELGGRSIRMTPPDLEKALCRIHPDVPRKVIRSAIKELVAAGVLTYTNHFNTTHLELNFAQPTQVSDRIILSPNTRSRAEVGTQALVLKLNHGGAFGIGDHPTTRLSLKGVDVVMAEIMANHRLSGLRVLDIGTGSGVLAMAAVGLGAESGVAVDIDAEALYEAGLNIQLNGMDHRIRLTAEPLESLEVCQFGLITANLRPPTLKQMIPMIEKLSKPEAYWIFSGWRDQANDWLTKTLSAKNAMIIWQEKTCGWGALAAVFQCGVYKA